MTTETDKLKANDCSICDPGGICDESVLCMCQDDYSKIAPLFDEDIARNGCRKTEDLKPSDHL